MTDNLEMVADLLSYVDSLGTIREAARGYREQLLADGWSSVSAERMAVQLHAHLIQMVSDASKTAATT